MKLYKYITILVLFIMVGCSDDAAESSIADEFDGTKQTQGEITERPTEEPSKEPQESQGALGHFAGQVDLAKQAGKMEEESERKKQESQDKALE
jgi:hypothetical protein